KLLKDMGFDLESSVCIRSSSTPDQLKDVLDVLLRRARIINFNEVELYFGGDIINLGNCISPRNELEALHSILEVIDKSLSDVEGAGRGAIANEDLKAGDIALEIPVSIIICEDVLHESDMFPIFEKVDGISEETMLLLWSMKEKHNNNSKFKLYFDTLPKQFDTGLSFGIDAVMALDGTLLLEEIVQAKEHLRAQYDELFPALSDHDPDVFPPELYTWEQFLWACELWYSNSMKVIFSDGKLRTCLIPIAGFLNHSICPHIMHYGRIDASTNSLKFPLSRPCHSGEQCFLSYGNFSSSHLLTFYGFLPQGDNPYDIIPLVFTILSRPMSDIDVQDEDPEVGPAPCAWSSHMVRGTWLSKNHELFHYGLPHPLLDHLRGARNSALQSSTHTRELLETDLDVLRDLSSTFEAMLENLGDEILDNGERTSWDVKLATEFKNLQRRIVSSILTSCNTGCELLESELGKYTV
ncbi:UNVERIFIED_CONTAM: hypothetical protein Sradi_4434500, partial [Sesamum radiatum]